MRHTQRDRDRDETEKSTERERRDEKQKQKRPQQRDKGGDGSSDSVSKCSSSLQTTQERPRERAMLALEGSGGQESAQRESGGGKKSARVIQRRGLSVTFMHSSPFFARFRAVSLTALPAQYVVDPSPPSFLSCAVPSERARKATEDPRRVAAAAGQTSLLVCI